VGLLLKCGCGVCGDSGAVAELLVVLFVVTVGLFLKCGGGVCGGSGAVAELLVMLFVVTVMLLLNYWSCSLW
jgi:hypothetical protein